MNTHEKKHKEEVVRATQLWECGDITRENLEYIFPELAESEPTEWSEEDDKILVKIITALMGANNVECADFNVMYNWLKSLKERIEE